MSTLYRIADWDRVHENHESRKLKRLQWFSVPASHDTYGYRNLMALPNGTALYGAYHQLLALAAKCEPRGTLIRGNGQAHTASTIAISVGGNRELIEECLRVMQDPEIGWISARPLPVPGASPDVPGASPDVPGASPDVPGDSPDVPGAYPGVLESMRCKSPGDSPDVPGDSPDVPGASPDASGRRARAIIQSNTYSSFLEGGMGGGEENPRLIKECSERMYSTHPKKRGMVLIPGALVAAVNGTTDLRGTLIQIETCHAAWCKTEEWKKENGRFSPKLAEWIADKGFTAWPAGHEISSSNGNSHRSSVKFIREERERRRKELGYVD